MSTTNPNTLWTPDFFWEAPPDAREHIEYYNGLSSRELHEASYRRDYFTAVEQVRQEQPPELIRQVADFVTAKVTTEGVLEVPPNPVNYASFRRAYNHAEVRNQTLRTIWERKLSKPIGQERSDGEDRLLTFEEQQARDAVVIKKIGHTISNFAAVLVRTDSREAYEWPKLAGLVKDWPLVEFDIHTTGLYLGVTYADYKQGGILSIPATPERIDEMCTYLEQFSSKSPSHLQIVE